MRAPTVIACWRCSAVMFCPLGVCSKAFRMTDSHPTRWVNALMYTVPRIAIRSTGTHHRGLRAISAKALPGEKKMPARRPASLIGGGPDCSLMLVRAGGDVGAGSGVIETVYSWGRRKTNPVGPAEGFLVFSEEIRANMADAV